ncbi:MAG: hypothetical protein M3004_01290 [Bacteroidota bacterium]|nr:hypothetical protein [Bacteroidota bacterium]
MLTQKRKVLKVRKDSLRLCSLAALREIKNDDCRYAGAVSDTTMMIVVPKLETKYL